MKKFSLSIMLTFCSAAVLFAKENVNTSGITHRDGTSKPNQVAASCTPSTSRKDLDINNIRCPVYINGDMWWDLVGNAQYEIPKDSKKYSLFAGALWIGGQDQQGNLKVAAQTYRQSGSDFWPGPVDIGTTTVSADVCTKYDRHWRLTREEVEAFRLSYTPNHTPITPSKDIKEWPGNGTAGQTHFLAPFHDSDGDGVYSAEPNDSTIPTVDWPGYNLNPDPTQPDTPYNATREYLLGDQTIWWVFNDVGNTHRETQGNQIGLEIQAQAFAFATNDEINNMTFYKYKIINRSSLEVDSTYFGAWVDPDLGNYLDDYVGCDVKRGFGYCYNGDAYDDGITGYGSNPPAIGYDFFQGPQANKQDGIDNDRDSCIDCTYQVDANGVRVAISDTLDANNDGIPDVPELIIMSKFVYYNNDGSAQGNPGSARDYYNYLRGIWRTPTSAIMTYGGTGHGTGPGSTQTPCDFMFPGCSDPTGWGTNHVPQAVWDEVTAGNTPNDRRFLQSAGQFTLAPGAVNFITTGAVWARAASGGPGSACSSVGSLSLILLADVKAQNLFDHNFAITNGPDAPDLSIRELSNELLFAITNPEGTNNNIGGRDESYQELDPNLTVGVTDPYYHFEGYQVYQLKNGSVTTTELLDPDKARIVFQSDIKNGVGPIVNIFRDQLTATTYGVQEVNGEDKGIRHVFRLTKDKFATGNDNLINHKTYYYTVIAYGYNSEEANGFPTEGDGKAYLAGRRRIKTYTAIPHISSPESNGLVLNTFFGDGPQITRIEGKGNGFSAGSGRLALDITQASVDEMFANNTSRILHPTYEKARGPVDVRVYDPLKVLGGDFLLWSDSLSRPGQPWSDSLAFNAHWYIKKLPDGDTLKSISTMANLYEQLVRFNGPDNNPIDYGFYVNMTQLLNPVDTHLIYPGTLIGKTPSPGFIEATLSFEDPFHRWLAGVQDIKGGFYNWIASGSGTNDYKYYAPPVVGQDESNKWGTLISGTWTAYKFAAYDSIYHKNPPTKDINPNGSAHNLNDFHDQSSVDIIFTSDKRYWSKCMVIEQGDDIANTIGHALKGTPRRSPSLDINGNTIANDSGFSYFPGYALNIETGERLNVAFGEDSRLGNEAGTDMVWNPTSTTKDANGRYVFGGHHIVYVFAHNDSFPLYDGCQALYSRLKNITTATSMGGGPGILNYKRPWASCMWVGYPLLSGGERLLSNKATVRIRVARPYEAYQTDSPAVNHNFPMYRFSTNDLVPTTNDLATAKNALSIINVVPNPYYAFSGYEKNQLDNRIKIINLPSKCTVSIYTPNGTLVRQLKRDVASDNTDGEVYPQTNTETALDWDMKNTAGIPVASGIYIIHIDAPGIGERTIKWFGVLRPIDLDTF